MNVILKELSAPYSITKYCSGVAVLEGSEEEVEFTLIITEYGGMETSLDIQLLDIHPGLEEQTFKMQILQQLSLCE